MFHPNFTDDIVGAEGFARIAIRKRMKGFVFELLLSALDE